MDYTALHVSIGSDNSGEKKRKSLRRKWNQLSKCQRNSAFAILTLLTIILYYWIVIQSESNNNFSKLDKISRSLFRENVEYNTEGDEKDNNVNVVVQTIHSKRGRPKKNKPFSGPQNARQDAVMKAFQHAWNGYKAFAWGHDHLKPISRNFGEWFGLGLSIVDSIDTMYIMGLEAEYLEARDWIEHNLTFDVNRNVNLFEVTIRVLGGLLSIYHLTDDHMFIDKATDLGNRLMPCFGSNSAVPYSDVNLHTRNAHSPSSVMDSTTSEVTTIQLEFRDLSRVTGIRKYERAASATSLHIHGLNKTDGLVPIFIYANTGYFNPQATITLGARGDSYYEYLLKQWLQTGKTLDYLRDDYVAAIKGVEKHLVRRTVPNGYLFIGELLFGGTDFRPKMDHLTCYLPGTLILGVHNGMPNNHRSLADELLATCQQTYAQQPTFLAPEISHFNIHDKKQNDIYVRSNDAHNLLRPEYVESLWYMYYFTGNKTFQDWGWKIFEAFEKYAKVPNGYTSIGNVKSTSNVRPKDMMESYFLSETLKYLYLLFADEKLIDLDKFVMNSEGHLLPSYNV